MVHNFKKFKGSLVGKSLKAVSGKEFRDDYPKVPSIKATKKICLKK
jgi:hypothetical protein